MGKTSKRLLIIIPLVIVAVLIAGGLWFWRMMGRPLYQPGMVRTGQNLRAPLDPPPQVAGSTTWRVEDDIELHHVSHGSGTPILFVHGGPGYPTRTLPRGLALLASDHEIHLYDQRGCGGSTRPFDRFASRNFYKNMVQLDRTLGIAAQIADIERIRRILGASRLLLIGHSFGGLLATLYAAEFPDRVGAMVLLAPADLVVFPQEGDGLFEVIRERLPKDSVADFDRFLEQYLDFSSVFDKSEAELAQINRAFAKFYSLAGGRKPASAASRPADDGVGGWMVTASYFGLGRRHDYRDAVRTIDAPVLILHGDQDLVPVSSSRHYDDLLPNASLQIISGAGHFIVNDRPTEFSQAVLTFLKNAAPD